MKTAQFFLYLTLTFSMVLCSCQEQEDPHVVRLGHLPNLTHVQALVARNMSRHGQGWFERYLPQHSIEWRLYSGGPSSMEAIFGNAVDVTYVGPSPAVNAYSISQGQELALMAGAVNGGSALLVAPQSGIESAADFKGKTIASPQLGNTQDVTCRFWLKEQGLSSSLTGTGDVRIAPAPSSMQAQLMLDGNIDASWTVEPWVSTIETKAQARTFLEEPHAVTTLLVGRKKWLQTHPQLAQSLLQAHSELTDWIQKNPEKAQAMVIEELSLLTQSPADEELIKKAWQKLHLTTQIDLNQVQNFIQQAQELGLLGPTAPAQEMMFTPPTPNSHEDQ